MANFFIEKDLSNKYKTIAGVDEAGRGPLAGPVVAAAVILDYNLDIFNDIDDSKKLSASQREMFFGLIIDKSISYEIQLIDNIRIDTINILNATMLAMEKTVENLEKKPEYLLIDGNHYRNASIPYSTIIKGDSKSISIAAASILAKVYRDKWIIDVADAEFPQYNFKQHKGYATKEHVELIKKYGYCKYHRRTFLTKILQQDNTLFD